MPERSGLPEETLFLCNCEASFSPDSRAIVAGLAASGATPQIVSCTNLCGREKQRFVDELAGTGRIILACAQEQAGFSETAEEQGFAGQLAFADIRDRAGWSSEGATAGAKMAALLAAARLPRPALPFVSLESRGVTLIYGSDETALELGRKLAEHLDITVLLARPSEVVPPRRAQFPIARGMIRQAGGVLGKFELVVDDFALAAPSSRGALRFGEGRNGAKSACDIIIDVSGRPPLFAAGELRDGYLRADPGDALAVERLAIQARDLVGSFDKPKYVKFSADLCAHSRSKKTGCTRCLEICPTGAISPADDAVAIDAEICAGCGGCASVCPTGAAAYALPPTDELMLRLRTMLVAYRAAGGRDAIFLFHDEGHGEPLIDALARFGDGLPARAIPVEINEVTQIGIAELAAAFAYGAAGVALLIPAKPRHDPLPLEKAVALTEAMLPSLGYPAGAARLIATDDPDQLLAALRAMPAGAMTGEPASFAPLGAKRPLMTLALREWHARAPQRPERVALPAGAPFGRVEVKAEGCTLCLACVSACPTAALTANPERPELRFQQDLCVQCGLCASTCPEKVASLVPELDFTRLNAAPVTLKQEEPYPCENCGKLFGTKSTIERIRGKLAGAHWMYSGANAGRLILVGYCEECRMQAAAQSGFDPYGGNVPERPRVRTSEDYFRERGEDKD